MSSWRQALKGDPLPWLLEADRVQPGVRYLALRDLLGRSEDDHEVRQARAAVMATGPVPAILAALGYARDPRLAKAVELVTSKQDSQGRWKLEYTYNGKTWVDIERKGQPSKWVTLRALRVLKAAYPD